MGLSADTPLSVYINGMSGWQQDEAERRAWMVETIRNEARLCARFTGRPELAATVLEAMGRIERHRFVPPSIRHEAYDDAALPAGHGQTISQPFIVALMTDLLDLQPSDRVLEIGTGTGYQTAVLAELAVRVFSVECVAALAMEAEQRLASLGLMERVTVRAGNGWQGWLEEAPFDAIIVTAAAERIPEPLLEQLAPGGRLVIPVGPAFSPQQLLRVEKSGRNELDIREMLPVAFVPLLENP